MTSDQAAPRVLGLRAVEAWCARSPGWTNLDTQLEKRYAFATAEEALAFAQRSLARAARHAATLTVTLSGASVTLSITAAAAGFSQAQLQQLRRYDVDPRPAA